MSFGQVGSIQPAAGRPALVPSQNLGGSAHQIDPRWLGIVSRSASEHVFIHFCIPKVLLDWRANDALLCLFRLGSCGQTHSARSRATSPNGGRTGANELSRSLRIVLGESHTHSVPSPQSTQSTGHRRQAPTLPLDMSIVLSRNPEFVTHTKRERNPLLGPWFS
jgi:hypothetical protein